MRFNFQGKQYSIEFRRHFPILTNSKTGEEFEATYPSTTALIYEVVEGQKGAEWPVIASATVGCLDTDKFTLESGRLAALKRLSGEVKITLEGKKKFYPCLIPKEMVVPMWSAYHNRPRMKKQDLKGEIARLREENAQLRLKIQQISEETEKGES